MSEDKQILNFEVLILLSTYNGEKYIKQQIDSIVEQTYTHWNLFIRDDGSADNTLNIIKAYNLKDKRITIVSDEKGNVGAAQSFSILLSQVKNYAYVMFADQDDVWIPGKIQITLQALLNAEEQFSSLTPLLIHTNFIYVSEVLQPIKSKRNYSATKIKNLNFNHLLAQNPAYGCTMMLNNALLQLVKNIPSAAENHDYWVAVVASAFGKIIYLENKTVLYRQHTHNISGNHDNNSLKKRFQRIFLQRKNFKDVQSKIKMAIAFKEQFFFKLSQHQKKILNDFIDLSATKRLGFIQKNISNGVRRQTLMQTVLFYISVFFLKNQTT